MNRLSLIALGAVCILAAGCSGTERKISGLHDSTLTQSFCKALDKQLRAEVSVKVCVADGQMDAMEGGDPIAPDTGKIAYRFEGKIREDGRTMSCWGDYQDDGTWENLHCKRK